MAPPTDIIITVRNAAQDFLELIETLKRHTSAYRLILVDDCSDEPAAAAVRQVATENPYSILIRTSRQRWFTRAVNLGLRMARTPRVIVLNSDCVVDVGWLDELYAVWDEASAQGARVAIVASIFSAEEQRRWTEYRRGKNGEGADYTTAHCWLAGMEALTDLSCARGTPGIYLNEQDPQQIHIASDRIGSWDLQARGWATIASFKSLVGHKGGRSWGYELWRVMPLRLEDVNDRY